MKMMTHKTICFCILLALSGCGRDPRKEVLENISVQDTANTPIVNLHHKKKNIGSFHNSSKTSVIFYTIQGCAACDEIYPFYKKMANKYTGAGLQFGKEDAILNRRHDPKIWEDSIYCFPTVCIYKNGKILKKYIGSKKIANELANGLEEAQRGAKQ